MLSSPGPARCYRPARQRTSSPSPPGPRCTSAATAPGSRPAGSSRRWLDSRRGSQHRLDHRADASGRAEFLEKWQWLGQGHSRGLVALFDRYGVDLVLCGHDHDYERSWPVRGCTSRCRTRRGQRRAGRHCQPQPVITTAPADAHIRHQPRDDPSDPRRRRHQFTARRLRRHPPRASPKPKSSPSRNCPIPGMPPRQLHEARADARSRRRIWSAAP